MHGDYVIAFCAVLLAGSSGVGMAGEPTGTVQPKRAQSRSVKRPAYWSDPRFEFQIRFPVDDNFRSPEAELARRDPNADPQDADGWLRVRLVGGRVLTPPDVLREIERGTGSKLLLQGDWMRGFLALPVNAGPARELMDSLARVLGGQWRLIEGTWVLAESFEAARLSMLSPEERRKQSAASTRELLPSLTPDQWGRLLRGERLEIYQLTPRQQELIMNDIRLTYFNPVDPPEFSIPREVLTGRGVYLWYRKSSGGG